MTFSTHIFDFGKKNFKFLTFEHYLLCIIFTFQSFFQKCKSLHKSDAYYSAKNNDTNFELFSQLNHAIDPHKFASYGKKSLLSFCEGCQAIEKRFDGKMKSDSKNLPRRKTNKNKRKRDRAFLTARNKHKKMKYSSNEEENDRKYLERCKHLVRLSKADF